MCSEGTAVYLGLFIYLLQLSKLTVVARSCDVSIWDAEKELKGKVQSGLCGKTLP